ncbi:MAG: exodeoxyribonuclease V subunit gamma, partial [Syntrophaceae bacterium]|nr:exodeoxyribonuclease V subunit gamma [Syntrophaceae bacterium]
MTDNKNQSICCTSRIVDILGLSRSVCKDFFMFSSPERQNSQPKSLDSTARCDTYAHIYSGDIMPGLHITTSNMMEILAARLADVMAEPLASPLDEEIVLINSRGMERWLSMQLAEHHGICANMSFRFPRPFFMDLLEKATGTFGSTALYQPDYLTWKIMKILPETSGKIGFEMIRHYLAPDDEGNSLKRYQLARRIAYVFDQYLVYRPEMILNWESLRIGNEEAWQAALWRSLFADAEVPNSAALFNLFRDKIRCSDPGTVPLPERISLIGISALPPLFINMIHFLATVTDIHLFLLNPCREYWSEILSEREMEKRLQRLKPEMLDSMSEEDLLLEKGNPLLASMGKISRDFLFAFADDTAQHQDFFALPGDTTLLRAVQSDILNLADRSKGDAPPLQLAAGDRSLEIHSCHSPMREVEVLYNRLLALFEEDPKLMPRDILVMAPDIDIYAPLIESVFNRTEEEMVNGEGSHIPFSIADRRHARNNPVSDAFFKILAVSESRFEASQVLALLDSPVIRDSFDIAEDETALIRRWVDETGIRWGIDAETLSNLNLPSLN